MHLSQTVKSSAFSFALLLASASLAPILAQPADNKAKPANHSEDKSDKHHAGTQGSSGDSNRRIEREVRHHLIMLPYYNLFDNLAFRVDGTTVTLLGQVVRPTLKSDAESTVKEIEGVTQVVNQLEVLPLSPFDDQLRLALYRAVYSQAPLQRYAMGAVPPIHIIVKNGNVTLEGVVLNEGDRNLAGIGANQVSGVFSVTNNLRTEMSGK